MQVVRMHMQHGKYPRIHSSFTTAIIGEAGRKFTKYIALDFPVRIRKILNTDVEKFTSQLTIGKARQDYPLKKAANHMLRVGRQHGISGAARKFLREARA
jgi:hypothetical protein